MGTIANKARKWIRWQMKEAKSIELLTLEEIKVVNQKSIEIKAEEAQNILSDFFPQSLGIREPEAERILEHLVKIKVISKSDGLLILNNVISGISLVELAKGYNSKSYKLLQKRKERALKAIQNHIAQKWNKEKE